MIGDLELAELLDYRPERTEPADFDAFWAETLDEARNCSLDATFAPVDCGLTTVDTFDVTFNGFGGQPIKGWLNIPRHRTAPPPCVIEYLGYTGGRGKPTDWLLWSAAGYAHFVMDTRGQGAGWRDGDTPDRAVVVSTHYPGFLTMGIDAPHHHYYRRLYTDAVRAIDAARGCELVDTDRIAVCGTSQGGGLALAAAGLSPGLAAVMPGVPFLCHFERAIKITDTLPYFEITRYLRANPTRVTHALRTLSYFDAVNLAARADAPTLFSVALMDQTCPPSTVFAAYNHYRGSKDIRVYEYNDHDGAVSQHSTQQLEFLHDRVPVLVPTA